MSNRPGFTYLEILATILIMTIALIPIMRIMPEGMKATKRVERLTQAGFLAQQKMENVRRAIFDPDYDFDNINSSEGTTAFASPFGSYKYVVTDNQGAGIKELNVTVWFDENDNDIIDTYAAPYQEDEVSVSLDTKIADR